MHDILVIGAGKIGAVVAELLALAPGGGGLGPGYRVTLADRSAALLAAVDADPHKPQRLTTLQLDVGDTAALQAALQGKFAVLSAAPYHLTLQVAIAARAAG